MGKSKATPEVSKESYSKSCKEYESDWKLLDGLLYTMCKQHKYHTERSEINLKTQVINGAYNAGVHRQIHVEKGDGQGRAQDKLSDTFYEDRKGIDRIIGEIRDLQEPLDTEKLKKILVNYGCLSRIVAQFTSI